jgi:hypothetical protein
LTIQFSNVTSGGTISVATIDPETVLSAPDPPAGFSLGDNPVYYEITPSEVVDVHRTCHRLLQLRRDHVHRIPPSASLRRDAGTVGRHHNSVDTATSTICGLTSSFSPFALAAGSSADGRLPRPDEVRSPAL